MEMLIRTKIDALDEVGQSSRGNIYKTVCMHSIFGDTKSAVVSRFLRAFVPETKVWLQV